MTRKSSLMLVFLSVTGLSSQQLVAETSADHTKQKIQVTKTEHIDFPPDGLLRMEHSTGEITVEGWDRPDVEITTTKSTKDEYDASEREKATRELDKVRIVSERRGGEVVITTSFPRHRIFPPPTPFGSATSFDVEYNIKVPRTARLAIDHNIGDIFIDEVAGNIHVTARQAEITVHLPADRQYVIDAKSDFGAVNSDFAGHDKREPWLIGHGFVEGATGTSQKIFLRARYGDIVLLSTRIPAEPGPATK